jgi:poly(3-hydroxybutyrate) depolymerase
VKIGLKTYGTKPPTREMIQRWAKALGCPPEPETLRDKDGVRRVAYDPCKEGSEVLLYTVEGMGHS